MGYFLAIYAFLWGVGFLFDPDFAQYQVFVYIGGALVAGAWMFMEFQWRLPWEIDEIFLGKLVDKYDDKLVLLGFILFAAIAGGFGYFFYYNE